MDIAIELTAIIDTANTFIVVMLQNAIMHNPMVSNTNCAIIIKIVFLRILTL